MTTPTPGAMPELLPCPFCGGDPDYKRWEVNDIWQIKIFCDTPFCHVHPAIFGNEKTMIEIWNTRAAITPQPVAEVEGLKNALRDVLKAIVSDRHAVQDTIWVNGTPIGDFIQCDLDEEIDLDELQNAPYRCKKTGDMLAAALQQPAQGVDLDDLANFIRIIDGENTMGAGQLAEKP